MPSASVSAASPTATSATTKAMTKNESKDFFLAAICPSTTSLKVVDNIQIEAGGWSSVKPSASRTYLQAAADGARSAAQKLADPDVPWSGALRPLAGKVSANLLGTLVPLGQMVKATSGAAMAEPWKRVYLNPRTAEQQLRLALGLPPANARNDGCPPIPVATAKPTADSGGGGSDSGSTNPYSQDYADQSRQFICLTGSSSLPTIDSGSGGTSSVRRLQWALRQLGYDPGPLDGAFGPVTQLAVTTFQYNNGLFVDGQVGPITWRAIKAALC